MSLRKRGKGLRGKRKESMMENKEFEVGKFYRVHLYPTYGMSDKGIPGMVVRKLKKKVVFEYLSCFGGELHKMTVERRLISASEGFHGVEEAVATGKWNSIGITEATDICDKPSRWDLVRGNEASGN